MKLQVQLHLQLKRDFVLWLWGGGGFDQCSFFQIMLSNLQHEDTHQHTQRKKTDICYNTTVSLANCWRAIMKKNTFWRTQPSCTGATVVDPPPLKKFIIVNNTIHHYQQPHKTRFTLQLCLTILKARFKVIVNKLRN